MSLQRLGEARLKAQRADSMRAALPHGQDEPDELWLTLAVNSIALGGLLFLLSAGFSLIFGLMRIPNLMHGSFFMLGAYFGVTLLARGIELLARGARQRRSPWP